MKPLSKQEERIKLMDPEMITAAKLIAWSGNYPHARPENFHRLCIQWLDRNGFDMATGEPLEEPEDK